MFSDTLLLLRCRAPLSFFHVTPTGRIINRLTKDTSDVDKNLADFAAFFLRSCLQLTSTIILVGVTTPFALPFLVPILLLFYFLYQYFQVGRTTPLVFFVCCTLVSFICPAIIFFLLRFFLISCSSSSHIRPDCVLTPFALPFLGKFQRNFG